MIGKTKMSIFEVRQSTADWKKMNENKWEKKKRTLYWSKAKYCKVEK